MFLLILSFFQKWKTKDVEANVWGINSIRLTFAYENVMYEVEAHTCSQRFMNKQWYNKLAPDLVPFLKVYEFTDDSIHD